MAIDREKIIRKAIEAKKQHLKKQEEFERAFSNDAISFAALTFSEGMDKMIEIVLDAVGVPDEQDESNKYETENWRRDVCKQLIKRAAKESKYIEPAVELICDWENLETYTSKVETLSWFYYEKLLDEHLVGYKNTAEKEVKETDKPNRKIKTA